MEFDWDQIEGIAKCQFDNAVRQDIEKNIQWYLSRSGNYGVYITSEDYATALKALGILSSTEFSRFQMQPIEDELATVTWFLDVMAQAPFEKANNIKYFLYSRIWDGIGKAGVKLSQGKGIPNHRLSLAQNVFREICHQADIDFPSDQALADALKRALKAMKPRRQNSFALLPP